MPTDAATKRRFIVATWDEGSQCQRELRQVQAKSHEEAVAVVAAARTPGDGSVVYDVWPATDPGSVLRITFGP